jgi:hypothetical protein
MAFFQRRPHCAALRPLLKGSAAIRTQPQAHQRAITRGGGHRLDSWWRRRFARLVERGAHYPGFGSARPRWKVLTWPPCLLLGRGASPLSRIVPDNPRLPLEQLQTKTAHQRKGEGCVRQRSDSGRARRLNLVAQPIRHRAGLLAGGRQGHRGQPHPCRCLGGIQAGSGPRCGAADPAHWGALLTA